MKPKPSEYPPIDPQLYDSTTAQNLKLPMLLNLPMAIRLQIYKAMLFAGLPACRLQVSTLARSEMPKPTHSSGHHAYQSPAKMLSLVRWGNIVRLWRKQCFPLSQPEILQDFVDGIADGPRLGPYEQKTIASPHSVLGTVMIEIDAFYHVVSSPPWACPNTTLDWYIRTSDSCGHLMAKHLRYTTA